MPATLTTSERQLMDALYGLLRDSDPARWRPELAGHLRERLLGLRAQLAAAGPTVAALPRGVLDELRTVLDQRAPAPDLGAERLRDAWADLRRVTVPLYERLAAALRGHDVHVPSLRPTNYARNVFHVFNGLWALVMLHHVLGPRTLLPITALMTATFWASEILRRRSPRFAALFQRSTRRIAHPHEAHRVNSATWYATALLGLVLMGDLAAATVAVLVLGFADPAAALVGRRFGRVPLVNGRTLEGTLTFAAVGGAAGAAGLAIYAPALPVLPLALAGAVAGALAELLSRRVDDNLSVPLAVGVAVVAARAALGL